MLLRRDNLGGQRRGTEKASLRHSNDGKKPVMQTFSVERSKCKDPETENKFDSFRERRLN